MKSIYQFTDYKLYLKSYEQHSIGLIKGFRTQLAKSAGCNNAFVSQVLNKSAHFSLEQGLAISPLLQLKKEEEAYFLNLIQYARAGTKALQDYFENQITIAREEYLNIKGRVKQNAGLSPEVQATYYSYWYYSAIHMAVTINELRTLDAISNALKLELTLVEKVLRFLLSTNLIVEKNKEFFPGPDYLHLENNSPNISKHHTNWRIRAIQSLESINKNDVHYSTVSTFSAEDATLIREQIVKCIETYVQTVSDSKQEENMYCFNLDFFSLM